MNQSHQTKVCQCEAQCLTSGTHDLLDSRVAAGLGLCRLQHTQRVSQFQGGSTPQPLLFLVVLSWCWCLQNAGVSTAPERLLLASLQGFWAATWCQASASLYGHSNPGAFAALEASFTSGLSQLRTVPGLSCPPQAFRHKCLLGGSYIVSTKSICQQGAHPGCF